MIIPRIIYISEIGFYVIDGKFGRYKTCEEAENMLKKLYKRYF